MRDWEDIAVIGMAGVFPEADDIETYCNNLRRKKDSIRSAPKSRLKLLGLDENEDYLECGYVEGIDLFDYEFFGFSKGEAVLMDPQKRMAMMLACQAFEHAGYSLDKIKGTRTAVILSAGNSGYQEYLSEENASVAQMGNNPGMIAGNIAYLLDLRAKAYMIDATCASSLLAVYQACGELIQDEADMALAGGVSLIVRPKAKREMDHGATGVVSKDMRSKAFDEEANGTGIGEGAGFVVLKKLRHAIKDKDGIYAVIKGGAVNHSGARSNSMAAPSPAGQKEVVETAWDRLLKSGQFPEMIEAHGTGTKIGDPIEIEGLTNVFGIKKAAPVYITAAKTNIGHLGMAAGAASFIKTVLSVYHHEMYPLVHFKKGNTLIDWNRTPITPLAEMRQFQEPVPRAGVTALGLSGTNVHILLEGWNKPEERNTDQKHIFTLSARKEPLLKEYAADMAAFLKENPAVKEEAIAQTLTLGRVHYPYRVSVVYRDKEELAEQLKKVVVKHVPAAPKLYVVCSGLRDGEHALWKKWNIVRKIGHEEGTAEEQYAYFYDRLKRFTDELGIQMDGIIGGQGGNIAARVWSAKENLQEISREFAKLEALPLDKPSVHQYLEQLDKPDIVYVVLEAEGELFDMVSRKVDPDRMVMASDEEEFLSALYLKGVNFHWEKYYKQLVSKVPLPATPFERISCWPQIKSKANHTVLHDREAAAEAITELSLEDSLKKIWSRCLGLKEIHPEEDFFELGGNSIVGIKLVQSINSLYGDVFEMDDLYSYSTIAEMAEHIVSERQKKGLQTADKYTLTPLTPRAYYELSDAQERMWLMNSIAEDKTEYNMPSTMIIKGSLDIEKFKTAFQRIADTHEAFRTTFHSINGKPVQKIHDHIDLNVAVLELSETEAATYKRTFIQEFDLEKAPLIRISIIKIHSKLYWVLMDMHHIISDGTSMGIISGDFWKVYMGGHLETNTVDYKDFAYWQRNYAKTEIKKKQDLYWKNEFEGFIQKDAMLPKDFSRPAKRDNDGELLQFRIEASQISGLRNLTKKCKVTLNTILLSFYYITLLKSSYTDEFVVGVPVTGRRNAQMEHIVGMFVNMLPIRMNVTGDKSYQAFLEELQGKLIGAYHNQDTQFNELVDILNIKRQANQNPIFDSVFVLQELQMPAETLEDTEFQYINEDKTAKFDMVFSGYHDKDDIVFSIRYWKKLFKQETIHRMIKLYLSILRDVLENDQKKISELGMDYCDTEKQQTDAVLSGFQFFF
ncbi:condensation domain-containing protein [Clostridium aminobutyricum]|uniref:Carrier domain-containing protein n=1 Tax=Clostridium aminobutyricum TaxID=33953 RepID=A0A939IJB6_CLOAM|nr:condensation domain-containing protein [Clostridium aminobutyricum]MBN7773936.1 hypothetical protein [Clostridium aminobutyricum]